MCLKLILAENRPQLFEIWSETFSNLQDVVILNGRANTLFKSQKIDAELMRGIFAHERYGGKYKVGESQILSTKGELEMAPWVVTTASFPAHLEKRQQKSGSFHIEIVQDEELTPEEESYILFRKAFKCIEEFNQENQDNKINILGIDLEFLGFSLGNPQKEANAALKAYLQHYDRRCKSQ
jgi:hypothetical protein